MEQFENLQLSEYEQEIFTECAEIVKPIFESLSNSDDAFEMQQKINELAKVVQGKGLNPQDYFLWNHLLGARPEAASASFDTPDGDIETFIRALKAD